MSEPPHVVIVAGPNGSGKSTLTDELRTNGAFVFPNHYINADEIAKQLLDDTQEAKERSAFRRARELRQWYREQGISFAFETVFSHPSNLLDMMKLHNAGYHITYFYVTTDDATINIQRVAARVQAGGHNVPTDKIVERYERSMRFLPRAVEIATNAFIYDATNTINLVSPFRHGVPSGEDQTLPKYLLTHLKKPLQERAENRDEISRFAGRTGDVIKLPDDEAGVYTGEIVREFPYYVVQRTALRLLIRHDATLRHSKPQKSKPVTITYQDGYGFVSEG